MTFEVGQEVTCINNKILQGNKIAPELVEGRDYPVKEIILDSKGNQHLDVGLKSYVEFVTSYETKEELDRGDEIHWCHPSRFILKQ